MNQVVQGVKNSKIYFRSCIIASYTSLIVGKTKL